MGNPPPLTQALPDQTRPDQLCFMFAHYQSVAAVLNEAVPSAKRHGNEAVPSGMGMRLYQVAWE